MIAETVSLGRIFEARRRIAPVIRRTPLVPSPFLSARLGAPVHFKLETVQDTGSFKVRGASNKLLSLTDAERQRGVVAVSTGNHGRAVAHVARRIGLKAVVCLSNLVPENKRAAIRALGAELIVSGQSQDDAAEVAFRLVREQGLVMVNPFDDPHVITGQGTIGLEILEDFPEIDTILVPISGGGLIGGIACALKSAKPGCRVVGISMEGGAAMYQSLKAGKPIQIPDVDSLADSLQGGIFLDNAHTFRMVMDLVDDFVLVSEDEIADAMAYAFDQEHLVLEGAGAVGIAALLSGKVKAGRGPMVLVLSGTNAPAARLVEIVGARRAWLDSLG
jgi:threonine dehydratase